MPDFTEVGDRVWVARYQPYDVNTCVIAGERGLLLVDTRSSVAEGRQLLEDLRRVPALAGLPVVSVVNTHEHHDHVLGNPAVRAAYPDCDVVCHEGAAAGIAEQGADLLGRTFSGVRTLDPGGRPVELFHPGRGHTGGDLVVRVPDAGVMVAGDLVEESAPPSYGPDCFPLEWARSLELVLELTGDDWAVVPGHGAVVDRGFVVDQRVDVGGVGETIRDLAGRGVPPQQALAAADWPLPADGLEQAVRRGYAQLPRDGRRLPLA